MPRDDGREAFRQARERDVNSFETRVARLAKLLEARQHPRVDRRGRAIKYQPGCQAWYDLELLEALRVARHYIAKGNAQYASGWSAKFTWLAAEAYYMLDDPHYALGARYRRAQQKKGQKRGADKRLEGQRDDPAIQRYARLWDADEELREEYRTLAAYVHERLPRRTRKQIRDRLKVLRPRKGR